MWDRFPRAADTVTQPATPKLKIFLNGATIIEVSIDRHLNNSVWLEKEPHFS